MSWTSKFFIRVLLITFTLYEALASGIKRNTDVDSDSSENKRIRTQEVDPVASLMINIEQRRTVPFCRILRDGGLQLLNPKENNILKDLVEKKNSEFLIIIFVRPSLTSECFNLYMEAIKMAIEIKDKSVMECLIKVIYDPFIGPPDALISYFIDRNDFLSIAVLIEHDFDLENYRGQNSKGLAHFLVERDQYALVSAIKNRRLFELKDKTGKTPIFYARNRKMIKIIRRRFPRARDQLDCHGIAAWQEAFFENNQTRLNALISLNRRIKKLKRTFLNYYRIGWVSSASLLKINRETILKSSLTEIQKISENWYQPRHEFFIKYIGENGIDNGGLKVDWVNSLVNLFFTDNAAGLVSNFTAPLFKKVDDETGVYAPNTEYNASVFKFAGSVIGLSFALNVPVKVKFIPAIYRALFNEQLDLVEDFIEHSPSIYRNLKYLLTPGLNLRELELTFPLKPDIRVSKRNLPRYIEEYSRYTLQGKYKKHIDAFAEGFLSVQGEAITNFMTRKEFIRVLKGKSDYTADDFVSGCKCSSATVLLNLGQIVSEYTPNQRGLLLKFITGSEVLPFEGFSGLKNGGIVVEVTDGTLGPWPTSSTCFNHLKLPPFSDYSTMKQVLTIAIESTDRIDHEVGVAENEGIELGLDNGTEASINTHDNESASEASDDDFESENSAFTRVISRSSSLRMV